MIRFLIGIALFVLVFLGYYYTRSKVVLVGFVIAYILALLALVASAYKDSKKFVIPCIKACIWVALGVIVWYACYITNWRAGVVALFGGVYVIAAIVTIMYKGRDKIIEQIKEERQEETQNIVDAIISLKEEKEKEKEPEPKKEE